MHIINVYYYVHICIDAQVNMYLLMFFFLLVPSIHLLTKIEFPVSLVDYLVFARLPTFRSSGSSSFLLMDRQVLEIRPL